MSERSVRLWWGVLGIGAFVLLTVIDVVSESEDVEWPELLVDSFETALIVASATGVALLTGSAQRERKERDALTRDLELARAEGAAWRGRAQSYFAGLGEEIEKQFEKWQLTDAEREVGLLMLKGFSHREIAGLRGTTKRRRPYATRRERFIRNRTCRAAARSAPTSSRICSRLRTAPSPDRDRDQRGMVPRR